MFDMMIMLAGRTRCDPLGQRPRDRKGNNLAELRQRRLPSVQRFSLAEVVGTGANRLLAWPIAKHCPSEDKSGFWAITEVPPDHGAFFLTDHERIP
jgi:hypothetical protein